MIISMKPAIGSISQILTRHLFFFINEKPTWDRQHDLNNEVCEELLFWFNNLDFYNGHKIRTNNSITKVVFSDASEKGYGSFHYRKNSAISWQGTISIILKKEQVQLTESCWQSNTH
uniref:Uncharacterized protein n=1 Tax=Clytia hemisphaerica TaxID=252671 RepID=A0A7M5X7M7_9CNID